VWVGGSCEDRDKTNLIMVHHLSAVFLLTVSVVLGQQTVPDGPRGNGGIKFESCGGFFGGSESCFKDLKVKLVKFSVQIGADGTDDDTRIKVCSDEKKKTPTSCCTTPYLKRTFRDDWSSGDLEVWDRDRIGNCSKTTFTLKKGLEVTLEKERGDSLEVTSILIDVEAETGGKTKASEQFRCGLFQVKTNSNSSLTKSCGLSGYEEVKLVNVTMGNTGTDEDVKVDICSDVNDVCCKTKLSSRLSDDWSKNDVEVWDESYFGKCKGMKYKVNKNLKVGLETKRVPKAGLVVNKLLVSTENSLGQPKTYDCKGYTMTGKTTLQNICGRVTPTTRANTGNKKPKSKNSSSNKGILSQVGSLFNNEESSTTKKQVFKG